MISIWPSGAGAGSACPLRARQAVLAARSPRAECFGDRQAASSSARLEFLPDLGPALGSIADLTDGRPLVEFGSYTSR
jgi:hypothetical protein